uniref:TGF_BETA_2 domain-containing protein n=1 Tax=Macrostomum lignano TaxID=282301 RepID=A0A1I8FL96_9PLAT
MNLTRTSPVNHTRTSPVNLKGTSPVNLTKNQFPPVNLKEPVREPHQNQSREAQPNQSVNLTRTSPNQSREPHHNQSREPHLKKGRNSFTISDSDADSELPFPHCALREEERADSELQEASLAPHLRLPPALLCLHLKRFSLDSAAASPRQRAGVQIPAEFRHSEPDGTERRPLPPAWCACRARPAGSASTMDYVRPVGSAQLDMVLSPSQTASKTPYVVLYSAGPPRRVRLPLRALKVQKDSKVLDEAVQQEHIKEEEEILVRKLKQNKNSFKSAGVLKLAWCKTAVEDEERQAGNLKSEMEKMVQLSWTALARKEVENRCREMGAPTAFTGADAGSAAIKFPSASPRLSGARARGFGNEEADRALKPTPPSMSNSAPRRPLIVSHLGSYLRAGEQLPTNCRPIRAVEVGEVRAAAASAGLRHGASGGCRSTRLWQAMLWSGALLLLLGACQPCRASSWHPGAPALVETPSSEGGPTRPSSGSGAGRRTPKWNRRLELAATPALGVFGLGGLLTRPASCCPPSPPGHRVGETERHPRGQRAARWPHGG